jgi:ABC-type multidrug transport system fused ATPase/permease subunit
MSAPSYRATLTSYLAPVRRRVVVLAALLLGSIGLQILVPQLLRSFIDAAVERQAIAGLVSIGFAFLVAGILNQLLDAGSSYLGADIGWTATNRLREELASHLLTLDMAFHNDKTPGEMIERVDGDVTAISDFISRFLVRLLGAAVLLVAVLVVCWIEDYRMGVAITLYVSAVLFLLLRLRNLAVAAAEQEREVSARLYGFVEERLAGIEDIRALGAGRATMARFVPVMRDFFFRTTAAWRQRVIVWVSANTAFWAGDALGLAVGTWLVLRNSITVGTGYLILQYLQLVRRPIEQVTQELQQLQKAAGGIVRIDELQQLRSRLGEGSRGFPTGPLTVEFDHVHFSYEERPVIEDVTFRLQAGTVLGLLGRTGGGKTTITRLLARLYDPDRGRVRLGGVDLREASTDALRHAIGVVTQDVQLFRASIRDNLTLFGSRSDSEVLEVLDRAGLGDWVRDMGLDNEVGSAGQGLSAGEQQLLAFARVFLQNPGIVILDEPSSRLDPATESLLATATERLFAGRTVVIVAHRLETVRTADEIMVVESGRVIEHGRRQDLAEDPASNYARLIAAGSRAGDLALLEEGSV